MTFNAIQRAEATLGVIHACRLRMDADDPAYRALFHEKHITLRDLDLDEDKLLSCYQKFKCKAGDQDMGFAEYVRRSGVDLNQFDLVRDPKRLPYVNPIVDPEEIMDFDELDIIESFNPSLFHDRFSSFLDN